MIDDLVSKTAVLESNLDHLSIQVSKLSFHIESSIPLIEKFKIHIEDEIARRLKIESLLERLSENVTSLSFIQKSHEKKISDHDNIILELSENHRHVQTVLKTSRWWARGIFSFLVATISGVISLYVYLEDKKDERHHDSMILIEEIEEKKKRLDYNREKYLIRNGKWQNG